MIFHPNPAFGRTYAIVAGLGRQRWFSRVTNLPAAVFLASIIFLAPGSAAKAADTVAANTVASNPLVSLATNSSALNSSNTFDVLDDKYRLAIGDQLSFRIVEDEDDLKPVTLTVTDSGELQVPYIGRYPAVGKTCKELALALKPELEKDYYKQATVIIAVDSKPKSRGKIYLVGAIRAPGAQDISSTEDLTVSRAILRAGGFSDFADGKNVRVSRGTGVGADSKKAFVVNVNQVFEKGKTENDLPLLPGDLIFVPERMIRF